MSFSFFEDSFSQLKKSFQISTVAQLENQYVVTVLSNSLTVQLYYRFAFDFFQNLNLSLKTFFHTCILQRFCFDTLYGSILLWIFRNT